MKETAGEFRI